MENMYTEFLHGSLQQNKMKITNYMTEYFGTLKLNMNSKIHDHLNIDVLKYMSAILEWLELNQEYTHLKNLLKMSYPESKTWDITQYKLWLFRSTPIMEVLDIM